MKSKDLDLMSVSEACQRLHVSRNTLYSLLESGDLKGFKVGRMWRIPDRSIWNYMWIIVNKVDKKLDRGEKFRFKIIRGKKIDSRMRTIRIVKSVNILKQGKL